MAAVRNEGTRTVFRIPNVLSLVPDEAAATESYIKEQPISFLECPNLILLRCQNFI